jgi:AcrR family transcriptional regulator
VSTPYEGTGRTQQKRRTREALIAAARDLVASGVTPTVEQAAAAAAISRPTAYRYFPNQRTLLAAAHPETVVETMLPTDAPEDPAERLATVIKAFTNILVETESQQRTMLRLSLEADPAERAALYLRQGRAIGWIGEALSPLRDQLPEQAMHKLVLAIRSAVGIEALSWLTDVAKLSRAEAVDLMSWSAQALLHAALTLGPPQTARVNDPEAPASSAADHVPNQHVT